MSKQKSVYIGSLVSQGTTVVTSSERFYNGKKEEEHAAKSPHLMANLIPERVDGIEMNIRNEGDMTSAAGTMVTALNGCEQFS